MEKNSKPTEEYTLNNDVN